MSLLLVAMSLLLVAGEDSSPYVTESLQTVKDNLLSGDNSTLCEALDTLLQVMCLY